MGLSSVPPAPARTQSSPSCTRASGCSEDVGWEVAVTSSCQPNALLSKPGAAAARWGPHLPPWSIGR